MVLNFVTGRCSHQCFLPAKQITLKVVDAGVNFDFTIMFLLANSYQRKDRIRHKKLSGEPAMSVEKPNKPWKKEEQIVEQTATSGCNCIGFGEMGIGNTSSAALIMSAVTGFPVRTFTGSGTGVNDEQLQTKINTLAEGL